MVSNLESTQNPKQARPSLYNGFPSIDDLNSPEWSAEVAALSSKDLGSLGIDGWRAHWSRVYEFPWAYGAIQAYSRAPTGQRDVLESGCGVTPLPFWLAGEGFRVTGIDLDGSCEAKWRATDVPCRPDTSMMIFERGDMLELPRSDASFDLVYSISAIEHTSDPFQAVVEMLRVLKPGGHLVLTLDTDLAGTPFVSWPMLLEIQRLLEAATRPVLPVRHVIPPRMLTFENRTIARQSPGRLLAKRLLDELGLRSRRDQTIFAWAGRKE